ncbi:MAG: 1-deoxy-D-xylulose-5-phosphate synthase [Oscillospiraceae bacterium]
MEYNLLDKINNPCDLKNLTNKQLTELCAEIRSFLINTISKTGGHLASNLGTVELTVAMHKVFDCPEDKFIFDVGHQCYTHKLLTNRKDRFETLRKKGGISGFPKPSESEYDSFISGHASTSISAAYGIAKAFELQNKKNYAVAMIGDGAFTGGEAYEALNNAGRSKTRLIVILNHNDMSISKNVGAFARYLSTIRSKPSYLKLKSIVEKILRHIPVIGKPLKRWLEDSKSTLKMILYRSTFFEELGYTYLGPIDGHDIEQLINVLTRAKESNSPVLIQVETIKGKGYPFAEQNPGAYHALAGFDVLNGGDNVVMSDCYSNVIGTELTHLADENEKICAITAAMKYGTGLHIFYTAHKDRFFDVGIAEGHAVTFAGGLASQGLLPVFCVYSSFLQRGYDQIIHDLAIDPKHVVLCVDRAGIVGEDGETHQGIFDVAFLSHIPGITIYSPEGYDEAKLCLQKAINQDNGVVAVRYPRGGDSKQHNLPISTTISYVDNDMNMLLISYGRVFTNCFKATKSLETQSVKLSLLKITQIAPLDKEMLEIALSYEKIFFVEEGIKTGGIAEQVCATITAMGYKGSFNTIAIENTFVKQGDVPSVLADLRLDAKSIEKYILQEM